MNGDEYESRVMDGWTSSFTDYFEEEDLILVVLYAEVDSDDDDDDEDDDWDDEDDEDDEDEMHDAEIRLLRDVLSKERKLE